ncbi:RNA polymerase sigma factor region1.1 domain-containing protein [Microvirga sp. 2YAF29]|uniref:RNA polymerase sigma factor region1.1 domain-containing protein n=1 Tax=Microvirga sp. 2YAF29 TaxID=3233031 RepID=UPI003F95D1D3
MQLAPDRTLLNRLAILGRERGHLTTEDLRLNLPVDRMSAEEIALIVVQLEGSGVAVELEDSLISPAPEPAPRRSAEIIPFPKRPTTDRARPRPVPLKPAMPHPVVEDPIQVEETTPLSLWIFALAGVLAFVAFTLIILATAI